jgi:hypothetical protein
LDGHHRFAPGIELEGGSKERRRLQEGDTGWPQHQKRPKYHRRRALPLLLEINIETKALM